MNKLWQWADGKKRTIALLYWTVAIPAMPIIFDGHPPATVEKVVTILGYVLTAIGLGHAAVKAATTNKEGV